MRMNTGTSKLVTNLISNSGVVMDSLHTSNNGSSEFSARLDCSSTSSKFSKWAIDFYKHINYHFVFSFIPLKRSRCDFRFELFDDFRMVFFYQMLINAFNFRLCFPGFLLLFINMKSFNQIMLHRSLISNTLFFKLFDCFNLLDSFHRFTIDKLNQIDFVLFMFAHYF